MAEREAPAAWHASDATNSMAESNACDGGERGAVQHAMAWQRGRMQTASQVEGSGPASQGSTHYQSKGDALSVKGAPRARGGVAPCQPRGGAQPVRGRRPASGKIRSRPASGGGRPA